MFEIYKPPAFTTAGFDLAWNTTLHHILLKKVVSKTLCQRRQYTSPAK